MDKLNELNKRILDSAPISIITIDKNGNITSANKYYQNFSENKNYQNCNIFTNDFFIREGLLKDYRRLLDKGVAFRKENCYERNNKGEDKYFKIIAVPLRDKNGNVDGALSMAVDTTDAVLFKNELEKLNRELEAKVKLRTIKLNDANKKLNKVLELKSTFMSDISHELRTSLAIIQGNVELSVNCLGIKVDDLESCKQVTLEIKRMSSMLSDLTLLSNSSASEQKLKFEKFNLDDLIKSTLKALKAVAREKNVKLRHKKNEASLEIKADYDKLERLLINLIRNAIRYNKPNGWVDVWAEEVGDNIVLKVKDNGIGIPKEHLSNVFERFYRVDKARSRREGGSGLGLAICKWVAEAHNGQIDVSSEVGKGTLFTVRLPKKLKKQ
ncbi:MAG: ATP-binding protein [Parcubacteria group bacterium]